MSCTILRVFVNKQGEIEGQILADDMDYQTLLKTIGIIDVLKKLMVDSFVAGDMSKEDRDDIRRLLDTYE